MGVQTMLRKNLSVLFVASMIVAATAVTTADAGVGGCRTSWCGGGGWEAASAPVSRGRADDLLGALSSFVPRHIVESLRILLTPRDSRPVQGPTSPSIEGVGGCRVGTCGGGGWQ